MFKLALRNIFRNRSRTALTLAAIATGVAAIVISGGFVQDIFVQIREATIHSRLGHLQIMREGYLEYGSRDPMGYLIAEPKPVSDAIGGLAHVTEVLVRLNFAGLGNNSRADLPVIGEGVEPDREARLGTATTMVAGRQLRDSDQFGALIGEGVASALQLELGSYLVLTVNTPGGALNSLEFEIVGIFRTFSKDYDDRAVRIPLPAAQQLLFTPAAHTLVVLLDDTSATDAVADKARAMLANQGYEVKPWYALADFYEKTVALYKRQLGGLQFIILVMLILSVASTINMAVFERTGEFGTLLALGLRRRQIFWLVLIENMILGISGGLLGVALGTLLAGVITSLGISMPPPPGSSVGYVMSIHLVPSVMIGAAFIGAIATILAALRPGRRAARLPVAEALRFNI